MKRFSFLLLVISSIAFTTAQADIIALPQGGAKILKLSNAPVRGMNKNQVRKKYGKATREYPAVGKPPISRWQYPRYDVYFEGEHVIHTVAHKKTR